MKLALLANQFFENSGLEVDFTRPEWVNVLRQASLRYLNSLDSITEPSPLPWYTYFALPENAIPAAAIVAPNPVLVIIEKIKTQVMKKPKIVEKKTLEGFAAELKPHLGDGHVLTNALQDNTTRALIQITADLSALEGTAPGLFSSKVRAVQEAALARIGGQSPLPPPEIMKARLEQAAPHLTALGITLPAAASQVAIEEQFTFVAHLIRMKFQEVYCNLGRLHKRIQDRNQGPYRVKNTELAEAIQAQKEALFQATAILFNEGTAIAALNGQYERKDSNPSRRFALIASFIVSLINRHKYIHQGPFTVISGISSFTLTTEPAIANLGNALNLIIDTLTKNAALLEKDPLAYQKKYLDPIFAACRMDAATRKLPPFEKALLDIRLAGLHPDCDSEGNFRELGGPNHQSEFVAIRDRFSEYRNGTTFLPLTHFSSFSAPKGVHLLTENWKKRAATAYILRIFFQMLSDDALDTISIRSRLDPERQKALLKDLVQDLVVVEFQSLWGGGHPVCQLAQTYLERNTKLLAGDLPYREFATSMKQDRDALLLRIPSMARLEMPNALLDPWSPTLLALEKELGSPRIAPTVPGAIRNFRIDELAGLKGEDRYQALKQTVALLANVSPEEEFHDGVETDDYRKAQIKAVHDRLNLLLGPNWLSNLIYRTDGTTEEHLKYSQPFLEGIAPAIAPLSGKRDPDAPVFSEAQFIDALERTTEDKRDGISDNSKFR